MIIYADTLLGRVKCVNPIQARQFYPITTEGQFETRADLKREAVSMFRTEVEENDHICVSPCEVKIISDAQVVVVSATIAQPLTAADWRAYRRLQTESNKRKRISA